MEVLAYVAKRLGQSIFVMIAVAVLAFALFRFAGDPVMQMTGMETSIEERERLREELGLDDPFPVQFARFIGDLLRGDFGYSFRTRRPVGEMILNGLPATFELGLVAMLISLSIGVSTGVYTALHPRNPVSRGLLLTTLIGVSIPTFVTGILLIFVFGVQLGWFPTFGRGRTVRIGWWTSNLLTASGLRSIVLPAMSLGIYQMTLTMRLVRAQMIEVMRTDHIRFAIARGLPLRRVHLRHALPNTLIPVITVVGLQFGGVIAFSIVTESVFQWPGLGLLFLRSIRFVDIPVMGVYLVCIGLLFVVINLTVDLLYAAIDPRIRIRGRA